MPLPKEEKDQFWMRQAIREARKGFGKTSPNPLVGALIVQHDHCVGKGFHPKAGQPHAERFALKEAGEQARGGTLYVTLEPCSTYGRTPPCTEGIIEAGISRVVIGSTDPNPAHNGKGIEILQQAGIEVTYHVLKDECDRLNEAFFHWIQHKKPFVLLKMAMTLDGKIATGSGHSQWITGEKARRHVQKLRQWSDAIMVGGETVRCDNPSLTVRSPKNWESQPEALIFTRKSRHDFDPEANIFKPQHRRVETFAATTPTEWEEQLRKLGERHITALLLEGGGQLASAALHAGIVNKLIFFVAPKILGGQNSRSVVGGLSPLYLTEAIPCHSMTTQRIGDDIMITAYPNFEH